MTGDNHPEKRPGPFAQDRSRTPPTKGQREKDYQPEKKETGEALKNQGKDDLGLRLRENAVVSAVSAAREKLTS